MKRYNAKQKFLVLIASIFIGLSAGLFAYSVYSARMTQWQRDQEIDFEAQTGSTKFKVIVDSVSVGGGVFCISALLIIFASRAMAAKRATEAKK